MSTSSFLPDLRSLEIFVAIAEASGIAAGARRLGITQPAASQALAALERQFGAVLVDRGVRPATLTVAGVELLGRAQSLLAQARALPAELAGAVTGRIAHLRVALIDSFAAAVGPGLVPQLTTLADDVTLWSGLNPGHERALAERAVDIAVVTEGDDALVAQIARYPLMTEPFILALPRDYAGGTGSLAELAAASDLIRYSQRSLIGRQIDRHLARLGIDLDRRLECDTTEVVLAMVSAGLGWAITTPLCVLGSLGASERVVFRPVPGPGFRRRLILLARRRELGEVPGQIAAASIDVIKRRCIPAIRDKMPWAADMISAGSVELEPADGG